MMIWLVRVSDAGIEKWPARGFFEFSSWDGRPVTLAGVAGLEMSTIKAMAPGPFVIGTYSTCGRSSPSAPSVESGHIDGLREANAPCVSRDVGPESGWTIRGEAGDGSSSWERSSLACTGPEEDQCLERGRVSGSKVTWL